MAASSSQTTASQRNLSELEIHQYEIQNFMKISQQDEFLNFDVEKLQCLLESDNLNITCEEDAYGAITRWFNHDVSARQEHLPRLVACLRLTQFDVDFLLTHIQSLLGCESLALQASRWIREPAARPKINIRFTEPRVGLGARNYDEKTLLMICKEKYAESPCVLQYNRAEDKWQKYANIKNDSIRHISILKDDNLLFIGGDLNNSASKKVLSWNMRNKTWRKLKTMNQARRLNSVVNLDGKIYAIGGCSDHSTFLQSVERYTASNGWKFVKPLNTARHSACAVTFNGKIYVMGGDNETSLKSVECYNPDANTWTYCADMTSTHFQPSATVHNGHIIVVGYFRSNLTLERYDPQRDEWSKFCSVKCEYCDFACASLDNKLWIIGGSVENENGTRVAVYNEEDDRWVEKSPLPKGWIYSCFVVSLSLLTSK